MGFRYSGHHGQVADAMRGNRVPVHSLHLCRGTQRVPEFPALARTDMQGHSALAIDCGDGLAQKRLKVFCDTQRLYSEQRVWLPAASTTEQAPRHNA